MEDKPKHFLIVDDHEIVRFGLSSLLEIAFPGCTVKEEASVKGNLQDGEYLNEFDIIILDLSLIDSSGLVSLSEILKLVDPKKVCIFSSETDEDVILNCMNRKVKAFIPKSLSYEELAETFETIMSGGSFFPDIQRAEGDIALSKRQVEILSLVAKGYTNEEIGRAFYLSKETIKHHLHLLYKKIGVANRAEAVDFCKEKRLI
jgi:DNA-binding NarL/FixJ family response regulator